MTDCDYGDCDYCGECKTNCECPRCDCGIVAQDCDDGCEEDA